MRPRLRSAAALAATAGLALTGCGGGSGAPTKAEYGRNADRLCAQLNQQVNEAESGAPTSAAAIAAYADRVARVLSRGVQAIDNIQRPDGADGRRAKAYVDELRRQVDTEARPTLRDLKAAALRGDKAGVQAAVRRLRSVDSSRLNRLARAVGADGCAT
jgi:DNA integrity scanning protein DisA with diadenylate cyclase activity